MWRDAEVPGQARDGGGMRVGSPTGPAATGYSQCRHLKNRNVPTAEATISPSAIG